ncbi:MAG: hypothetical protein AB7H90_21050 [Alphaproteobacteria bacterium]
MNNQKSDTPQEHLRKALEAEKQYEEAFEQGPVGRILAKDSEGNYIALPEQVPAHFFHTGATAADDIRAYLAAGGDICTLEDYAASVLRSSGIIKADASADIEALKGWIACHAVALSALPGFRKKVEAFLEAQYALRQAFEAKEEALTKFYSSPAALFLNNDPITAVEKLFSLPEPTEAMRDLVDQLQHEPKALADVQKAVIDFVINRIGLEAERHPAFCNFLDKNRSTLAFLFDHEKLSTLDNIAADIRRSALSLQVENSRSAPDGLADGTIKRKGWKWMFRRSR